MNDKMYMQYDLIEVAGTRQMTCWLSNTELNVGDRITLKNQEEVFDSDTCKYVKLWWQVLNKYSSVRKTKDEIEYNRHIELV